MAKRSVNDNGEKVMRREVLRSLRVLACAGPLLAGTAPALAAQEPEPYEAKSPEVARRRSILGTVVPIAAGYAIGATAFRHAGGPLVFGGLLLGPVLGYVYAGEARRGMAQAGIRAAVLVGTAAVVVGICAVGDCNFAASGNDETGGALLLAAAVVVAGGVYTIVLAVRDINQVDDRVRARNQRLGAVSVQPTYFPESRTAGLLVTWRH